MRRIALWTSLALGCSRAPAAPEPAAATAPVPAARSTQSAEPLARAGEKAFGAPSDGAPSTSTSNTRDGAPGADAPRTDTGTPCGSLDCLAFESPEAAFEHVLARAPRVLAVGETHAQKGSEGVPSATERFSTALLPRLSGRASDLVIELMLASGRCGQAEKQVQRQTEAVTEHQAPTAKNAFVELGHRAKALGIAPHALTPTCDEYTAITRAGASDIALMLETVARVTARTVNELLAKPGSSMIVSYGGAIHNDVAPRPGREAWSFAPELAARAAYVELDLIVPEYVKDTEAWRAQPWYDAFASARRSHAARLFRTAPNAFALVFASQEPQ